MTSDTLHKWHTIEQRYGNFVILTIYPQKTKTFLSNSMSDVRSRDTQTTTRRVCLPVITLQETSRATECTSADDRRQAVSSERIPTILLSVTLTSLSIPTKSTET